MTQGDFTGQLRIQDFPLGGANLQRGRFLVEMYAKTKELGPVGGEAGGGGVPLGPATAGVKFPTYIHDYEHVHNILHFIILLF